MAQVNARDVDSLGRTFLPLIEQASKSAALSPDRSPAPACPVYILHGADDNVVPAIESAWLGQYLAPKTPTRTLLSHVITHAELNSRQDRREIWALVDFFASLMRR
jgi:pimeloyl-ACP methyl ester carboxylesterase